MVATTKLTQRPVKATKVKTPVQTPATVTEPPASVIVEPKTMVIAPHGQIHGARIMDLYQGDYLLSVFADRNMHTFVTYYKDDVIGVMRGHRNDRVTTYGLHITTLIRLAVNHSEEAAANYVAVSDFFDRHLSALTMPVGHVLEVTYAHGEHEGYMFLAGKSVMYDDDIPPAAQEDLFRAVPYVKNFIERFKTGAAQSAAESLIPKQPRFGW